MCVRERERERDEGKEYNGKIRERKGKEKNEWKEDSQHYKCVGIDFYNIKKSPTKSQSTRK